MAKKKSKKLSKRSPNQNDFVRPTGQRAHKKNLPGAPSIFSQEIQDKIVGYLMIGSYVETAAQAAGISKDTFYKWLKKGAQDKREGKSTQWSSFSDAVGEAVGKSELRDLNVLDQAAKTDWRAAAWKLERRAPKRWGPKAAMKIETGDKEGFSDEENIHAKLVKMIEEVDPAAIAGKSQKVEE